MPPSGKISMMPKLVPACQTPAKDGTVFVTDSEKIRQSRAMVEEDLLIDHPIDCPICDKAGECYLQDYHFEHGQKERRADIHPFTSRRREMGDTVTLFVDRCVMCTRCVRFCREVAGSSELMVINRGSHEEIDVFPGFPLENKLSGNVVDLCPVGALGDKDFLYRQRVWFMNRHAGVCTGCSTGCSIWTEENQDTVHRLKPRENPHINKWWMCDDGRYGWHHVHDEQRLVSLRRREGSAYVNLEWQELVAELSSKLQSAGRLAAVISPHLTVEEAYLLAKYIRGLDPDAVLALGPVPVVGEDEHFKSGFTIRAEKCPNRRGVEAVIAHFTDKVLTFPEFLSQLDSGAIGGVWVSGGYPQPWIDETTAARFAEPQAIGGAGSVHFAVVGPRHVPIARCGVPRARRLVRQFCRSTAIGPLGDSPARRRVDRRLDLLAVVEHGRAVQRPQGVERSGRHDSLFPRRRQGSGRRGRGLEDQPDRRRTGRDDNVSNTEN